MTESIVAKTMFSMVPVPTMMFAAVETSTQVAIVQLASLAVSTLGVIAAAWIAFKQAELRKTVDTLEHNTNSMREAIVTSTGKAERAEGVLEGVSQAETKHAMITAATAAGEAKAEFKKTV